MECQLRHRLRLLLLIVILAVAVAALMTRAFGGWVREAVEVPFLYLAWIVRVYVQSVPRALFWGGLLLFGVVLAMANALVLFRSRGEHRGGVGRDLELDPIPANYVRRLAAQIRFAGRSLYFRRSLAKRLGMLIIEALEHKGPYRPTEVKRSLDDLNAPPTVHGFFRDGEVLGASYRCVGILA